MKVFFLPHDEGPSAYNVLAANYEVAGKELIPFDKFSLFRKLCITFHFVRKYLKKKLGERT